MSVNITRWLTPLFEGLGRSTGIPANQWAAHLGGELYGWLLDIILDVVTPKGSWFDPVIKLVAGLAAGIYGAFGANVIEDNRRALVQFGETTILSAIRYLIEDPNTPANSFAAFVDALQRGDWGAALSTMVKGLTPTAFAPPPPPQFTAPPPPPPQQVASGVATVGAQATGQTWFY
jgi:hypothetical protein